MEEEEETAHPHFTLTVFTWKRRAIKKNSTMRGRDEYPNLRHPRFDKTTDLSNIYNLSSVPEIEEKIPQALFPMEHRGRRSRIRI